MGLGRWPDVSLSEARKDRDRWLSVIRDNRDPISERRRQKAESADAVNRADPTFAQMAKTTFEARKGRLRGEGKNGRWFSPLDLHVIPHIGNKRMSEIHQSDIKDALAPIWRKMPPTATKAIRRTRIVFETAQMAGLDCSPFTVDQARHLLGEVNHKAQHLPALPWNELPALYERIPETMAGHCLKWSILTCVRPGAARGAQFSEIDGDTWTVPAERVKGMEGRVEEFRVPLSAAAMSLAEECAQFSDTFLFLGQRGGHLTDVAVTKCLRSLHESATVHGFRSTFRVWVEENDVCSYDVAETVLGHTIGSKIERSYQRSDRLERRRPVMEAWAGFVTGGASSVVRVVK